MAKISFNEKSKVLYFAKTQPLNLLVQAERPINAPSHSFFDHHIECPKKISKTKLSSKLKKKLGLIPRRILMLYYFIKNFSGNKIS